MAEAWPSASQVKLDYATEASQQTIQPPQATTTPASSGETGRSTCVVYPCVPAAQNVSVTLNADYTREGRRASSRCVSQRPLSQPRRSIWQTVEATGTIEDDAPPRLVGQRLYRLRRQHAGASRSRLDEPARDDITVRLFGSPADDRHQCLLRDTDAASCPSGLPRPLGLLLRGWLDRHADVLGLIGHGPSTLCR